MIRLGRREEVEEYFEKQAVSQSFIKALLNGVDFINHDNEKNLYYEEKGHFIIGSGVDVQITQGQIEYDNQYHHFSNNKPSDTIMSIVNKVYDDFNFEGLDPEQYPRLLDLRDLILESCDAHKYSTGWKEETRINKIIEGGSSYFNELITCNGKQITSDIENQVISNIVMSFKTHKHTSHYFKDEGFDIFYQIPIYFKQNGVYCKVLIDMLLVDHKNKQLQPIDLKTMSGKTRDFPKSLKKMRYDIQASFYTQGLSWLSWSKNEAYTPIIELEDSIKGKAYKINPFKFIVETTDYKENKITGDVAYYQGTPLVYVVSKYTMLIGKSGKPELNVFGYDNDGEEVKEYPIVFQEVKGWWQGLELYKWHEQNGYEYDKEVFENNGKLLINF